MKKYGIGLILAASACSAFAGINEWTLTGPDSGPVWFAKYVTTTPGVAVATAGGAVYRTTDNGTTWSRGTEVSITGPHTPLIHDPSNPNRVVSFGAGLPVLLSEDGGQTFVHVTRPTSGGSSDYETSGVISSDGQVWYFGTLEGKVYRSSNRGATWQLRSTGLPVGLATQGIKQIVVDPRNANSVFVAIYHASALGLYFTSDGGQNWSVRSSDVCATFTYCNDIAIDPDAPDRMLAATAYGMYLSINAGVSWTQIDSRYYGVVEFDPTNADHVIAATLTDLIVHSNDGGLTWPTANTFPVGYGPSFAFDPLQAGRVLLCTVDGIFLSTDGGIQWSPRYNGIRGANISRIVSTWPVIPPNTIAIGGSAPGIFSFQPTTQTWSPLGAASIVAASPTARLSNVAFGPSASNVLYAGGTGGFFASANGGSTWTKTTSALDAFSIGDIAVSRSDSQMVYIHVLTGTDPLRVSTNGGATFVTTGSTSLPVASSNYLYALDQRTPTTVYAREMYDGPDPALFKSVNSGVTWTAVDSGFGTRYVNELLVDPTDSSVVYAATNNGLFKSVDGAQNWTLLPGNAVIRDIDVDVIHPTHLIRVAQFPNTPPELQRSVDAGTSWQPIQDTNGFSFYSASFDFTAPSSVMVSADNRGVAQLQIAPDLELTSTVTALAMTATQSLRLDVRNRGPYAATDILLRVRFPITGARVQSSPAPCTIVSTQITCPLGTIHVTQAVTIVFDAPEMTTGQVTAEVGGREVDSVPTNNSLTFNVERQSDVGVTVSPATATVAQGGSTTLAFTLTNGNYSPAQDVRVLISHPAELQLAGATSSIPCTDSAGTLTCIVGSMNRFASQQLSVVATGASAGVRNLTATISAQGTDPIATNNAANATVTVDAPPTPPTPQPPAPPTPAPAASGGGGGGSLNASLLFLLALLWWSRSRPALRPSALSRTTHDRRRRLPARLQPMLSLHWRSLGPTTY